MEEYRVACGGIMPRDEPQVLASQQQADAIIWDLQKQAGFEV